MQSPVAETEVQNAQRKMANAILRLENAVRKIKSRESARNQSLAELDSHISNLEQLLDNSKEK